MADTTFAQRVESVIGDVGVSTILATVNSIDGTTTGATTVYTVTTGKKCVVTSVNIRLTSISGSGNGAKITLGTNSTAYDNLMALTDLKTFGSTTNIFRFIEEGVYYLCQSTDIIKININNASTYTTYVMSVDLIGYEV